MTEAERLQRLCADLARVATRADVTAVVAQHVVEALGAHATAVCELTADGSELQMVHALGFGDLIRRRFERIPLDTSIPMCEVARTREPIFLHSRAEWSRSYAVPPTLFPELDDASWAALPLCVEDRVIGALGITLPGPHSYSDSEKAFMRTFADLCAQSLERARLYEAERDALRSEHFLAEAGSLLAESLDYETTLRRVADLAVPQVADMCIVYLFDGDRIDRVATGALTDEIRSVLALLDARYPMTRASGGLVVRAINNGETHLVSRLDDAQVRAGALDDDHYSLMRSLSLRSLAVVPMVVRGQIIGAIQFSTGPSGRSLGEREFGVARRLAERAALAIDQAKLLRSEQLARREAEEANRIKADFLAKMSHELRTPLNAIAGYVELLQIGIHGEITDPQRDALDRIRRAEERLLGLITDILDYARIERGRVEYRLQTTPIAEVVTETAALIEPQATARGLTLRVTTDEAITSAVADREKLTQVILNLLSNAIKFTPNGGSLTVDATAHPQDTHSVVIRVADTGVGIPSERLDQIFEPFVQLSPSRSSTVDGAGLGLAISREFARGMGGDIHVESALGQGSTFTVQLPRA